VDGILQALQQRETVHHRHPQIEDDGVRRVALRYRQALLPVEGHERLEAGIAEPEPYRPSDLSVVVNDQDTRL
jgi:hypothetical protein